MSLGVGIPTIFLGPIFNIVLHNASPDICYKIAVETQDEGCIIFGYFIRPMESRVPRGSFFFFEV